jgi:HAD superfamily hydrolase (TIGR01490 family)
METTMEATFFDLDKTIISRSSSLALSRPLYRAGMVTRSQLLRGAYAQLVYLLVGADEDKMERLKEGMLSLTKGWNREQVETLVREVIFDVIDPYVYQEALDLMALHRSEGRRIYIVSSSPEEVVRPLSQHFGASGVIATRAEIDDDGRYTGQLAFYAYGPQKAEAIEELAGRLGIDLDASYAYSDSITDLPMLSVVGHPVAVNPDRELRREAEERGWQVRDFRRLVRLRTRIAQAVPPPKPSIAAAAGGAAVAAVLAWVVLRSRMHRREA